MSGSDLIIQAWFDDALVVAPAVNVSIAVDAGSITITGQTPTISVSTAAAGVVATLTREWTSNPAQPVKVKDKYRAVSTVLPSALGMADGAYPGSFTQSGTILQRGNSLVAAGTERLKRSLPRTLAGPLTFVFRGVISSTSALQWIGDVADAFRTNAAAALIDSTGAVQFVSGVQNATTSAGAVLAGDSITLIGVGSATATTLYLRTPRGVTRVSSAASIPTGLLNVSHLAFTGGAFSGASLVGSAELSAWLNCALSDGEALALLANPWQIFEPQRLSAQLAAASVQAAQANVVSSPAAGTITITGAAPAVVQNIIIGVPAGTITCTGATPVAVQGTILSPAAGAIVITGIAPTALRGSVFQPNSGAITITGPPPTLILGTVATPGAGTVTISGLAPTVTVSSASNTTVSPAAGSITLSGIAPTPIMGTVATPAAGSITIAGQAPAAIQGTIATPGAGTISVTGQTPAAVVGTIIAPAAGTITISGQTPTVTVSTTSDTAISPAAGSVVISGATPTVIVGTVATPAAGTASISGQTPTLIAGAVSQPDAGTISITGVAPTVLVTSIREPSAGTVTITGQAPTVVIDFQFEPPAGSISVQGQTPVSVRGTIVEPGAGTVTLAGQSPTVSNSTPAATALSAKHAAWLEALARTQGLIDPLTVSATQRTDGTLIQSVGEAGGTVTLSPVAVPSGVEEPSALTPQQAAWLEGLMRVHGLLEPLVVTETSRTDGTLAQTIETVGTTTTVTRTA